MLASVLLAASAKCLSHRKKRFSTSRSVAAHTFVGSQDTRLQCESHSRGPLPRGCGLGRCETRSLNDYNADRRVVDRFQPIDHRTAAARARVGQPASTARHMTLLSTLLLAGTCVSTKVGWLGDIEDDTYAAFLVAANSYNVTPYNVTPVTHFSAPTAAACGDLDGLRDCAAVVTPLTGTLLTVAAQRAADLNLTLLTTRSTEEGSYYRLGPQPRHRLQALVDLAAVYDWRAIGAVVDVEYAPRDAARCHAAARRRDGIASTGHDLE